MKTLLLLLLLISPALAQSDLPIIGDLKDIASFTKVYVASNDASSQAFVVKRFEYLFKNFEIVKDPSNAQFFFVVTNSAFNRKNAEAYYFNSDKKKVVAWSSSKNVQSGYVPAEAYLVADFQKAWKKLKK